MNFRESHQVNSVQIRSYFWFVFSCIRTEYGREITLYLDIFQVVSEKQNSFRPIVHFLFYCFLLTHFKPLIPFYTPWKHKPEQEVFCWGYRKRIAAWNEIICRKICRIMENIKIKGEINIKLVKIAAEHTAQKMKFSIKYFFSRCDQIRSFLRIWSNLLNKSLMENFIFCAVVK